MGWVTCLCWLEADQHNLYHPLAKNKFIRPLPNPGLQPFVDAYVAVDHLTGMLNLNK